MNKALVICSILSRMPDDLPAHTLASVGRSAETGSAWAAAELMQPEICTASCHTVSSTCSNAECAHVRILAKDKTFSSTPVSNNGCLGAWHKQQCCLDGTADFSRQSSGQDWSRRGTFPYVWTEWTCSVASCIDSWALKACVQSGLDAEWCPRRLGLRR